MRYQELFEGKNTPCIVVDVQPEYTGVNDGDELPFIENMMEFLNGQRGSILAYFNGEELTSDNEDAVKMYWEDSGFDNWSNVEWEDKGYGFFRGWMDNGIDDKAIIMAIREMYKQRVNDTRNLWQDEDDQELMFEEFFGEYFSDEMLVDPMFVEWTSVGNLKKYSGCYIMGGGRNECLREVELLMNAFNIKYKRIEDFIYG